MNNYPHGKDPPGTASEENGVPEDPESNPVKTYANIVDDLKRVTMEEVNKFEEEYNRDEKKWETNLNIPRNDHEMRKSYLQQIVKMRNIEKKTEIKYNILKFKVTEIMEPTNKNIDVPTTEWAKRTAATKTVMRHLGNENWAKMSDGRKLKKNAVLEEGETLTRIEAKNKDYIVSNGEFVVGDMVYIPFNRAFNPAMELDVELYEDVKLAGKTWKVELMDREDVLRGEGAKSVKVRLENAASRFTDDEIRHWCKDFGHVQSIKRIDPNREATRNLLKKAIEEGELSEDDAVLFDENYDNIKLTARDYELKMTLRKNFPTILPIADVRIRVAHERQIPQCLNCFRQGHLASFCANPKIDYGTYSLFANLKWGTEEHKEMVKETRLREVINHKKLVMNEFKRGKRMDNIKPRTNIGKVAQMKVQELIKTKMGDKLSKKKGNKEIDDKC